MKRMSTYCESPKGQELTRTGFKEKDLVDYNAENVKIGASFHHNFSWLVIYNGLKIVKNKII